MFNTVHTYEQANSLAAVAVTKIDPMGCTVAFSPYITSQLNFMDVSADAKTVKRFAKSCFLGQRLVVAVKKVVVTEGKNKSVKQVVVSRADVESLVGTKEKVLNITQPLLYASDLSTALKKSVANPYKAGQIVTAR